MYVVYVIQSERDKRLYKGFTNDLEKRIKEHNSKKTASTKAYTPWVLVYFEEVTDRTAAREREKYLKSGIGREYLKKIIKKAP
ncbi:GIY-YIG nuclease family protein [Polaribacter sp. BAL334]|uniref:GIY-YIG nuclease family protein n=1 Tax=Polaribacter sp. BAL334 TaxID=1708178 RepID=UPI0018D26AFA|nr:GIY-YIG nuclease family protein [Polaribacter sp. BAL334]MBG7610962.1 GIY-YIG nuclease family protein [Polaribacter sp. BAL334]